MWQKHKKHILQIDFLLMSHLFSDVPIEKQTIPSQVFGSLKAVQGEEDWDYNKIVSWFDKIYVATILLYENYNY